MAKAMAVFIKQEPSEEVPGEIKHEIDIKTEIKCEIKTEEDEWPEQMLTLVDKFKQEQNTNQDQLPLKLCKVCQQPSSHTTAKCPSIVCSNCGENGHVEKICLKVKRKKTLTLLTKNRGRIKHFKEGEGMLSENGRMWYFSQPDSSFQPGDFVVFDMHDGEVSNVVRVNEVLRPETKKRKISEDSSTTHTTITPECPICILDIHLLGDQVVQIGAVILNGPAMKSFFRPITPVMEISAPKLKSMFGITQTKHGKYVYNEEFACFTEKVAFDDLIKELESFTSAMGLYTTDLDKVMPILKIKLEEYKLMEYFCEKVHWVADLKSVVRSQKTLYHFKTFCWSKFYLIYEHVMEQEFPMKKEEMNAKQTAELLWVISDRIFNTEDVQTSKEFLSHFYPARVLVHSELPNTLCVMFASNVLYQSCLFKMSIPFTLKTE